MQFINYRTESEDTVIRPPNSVSSQAPVVFEGSAINALSDQRAVHIVAYLGAGAPEPTFEFAFESKNGSNSAIDFLPLPVCLALFSQNQGHKVDGIS